MKTLFILLLSWAGLMTAQAQTNNWKQLLSDYLTVEDALFASNVGDAKNAIGKMQKEVQQLQTGASGKSYEKELKFLGAFLDIYGKSESLEEIRSGFQKISGSMITLAEQKLFGSDTLYVMFCPSNKASWLDDSKEIKNPYYGIAVTACGSIKKTIY